MSAGEYAELLGFYLGDGHITQMRRTERLRIFLDARHPLRRVLFINRTGRYTYLSAVFSNHSSDILGLFCWACDLVRVEYRRGTKDVRIYRRASVREFAAFVGLKR